jgi:hypothetical protein
MSLDKDFPDWVNEVFETIAEAIDLRGPASLEGRHFAPDETSLGITLLEIAPALMEIEIPGPADGEEIYGIYHNVDLMQLQKAFTQVSGMSFGFDAEGEPQLWFEGKANEQDIVVIIHSFPFEDSDVSGSIGNGTIRLK